MKANAVKKKEGFLQKITNVFVDLVEKYMPDPFIFAATMTVVVFLIALFKTDSSFGILIDAWSEGLWGLLVFTMQISIALVFSTAVIKTGPVRKVLDKACSIANTPTKAYFMASFVAGAFGLMSWAAGLVVGAFMARELAKKVDGIHYPLLVAAGYSGFAIWHMGYTSSTALSIATPGHFLEEMIGIIPTSQTILAPFNLITAGFLLFTIPILMTKLQPTDKSTIKEVDRSIFDEKVEVKKSKSEMTVAEKIENARIINLVLGIAGAYSMFRFFRAGGGLTMNSTNMSFLTLALLLSKTPKEFIDNCVEGGSTLGPIVMQFPLYGGIMGIMVDSGLASIIANGFVQISNQTTLPLFSFLSAGLINFFVPSGGSQWAVQGPIMMEAAQTMGIDPARVAMAVAWGDQWTNMIQPFWALPLLAIANMKAKDIMGYCIMVLIYSGIIFSIGITFL